MNSAVLTNWLLQLKQQAEDSPLGLNGCLVLTAGALWLSCRLFASRSHSKLPPHLPIIPPIPQSGISISEINIFPIKSCGGINLVAHELGTTGFKYDRHWMVVTADNGSFRTLRQHPKMSLIIPRISKGTLFLTAPNMKEIHVPLTGKNQATSETLRSVRVWKSQCDAVDEGDELANWFTQYLGEQVRLVRAADNMRLVEDKYRVPNEPNGVEFADGFPFLLISEASLAQLNQWIGRGDREYIMRRFRPNIVVRGVEAFGEEKWKRIRVGDVEFFNQKPCGRCRVTTIIPEKGQFGDDQPLATLKEKHGGNFGVNLVHTNQSFGKKLTINTAVEVVETKDPGEAPGDAD